MSSINQPAGAELSSNAGNAHGIAGEAVDSIKRGADEAIGKARDAASDIKDDASKLVGEAVDKAKTYAEENKGKVAGQIDSLAVALTKAADELDASDQAPMAGYARQLAGGVREFTGAVRDKGVDELMGMVGTFARNNPAAFIGGAALLGFAASRFAMAGIKSAPKPPSPAETSEPRSGQPSVSEPWTIRSSMDRPGNKSSSSNDGSF